MRATAYDFGQFRLDPKARSLRRGEAPVSLTPKAFDTLVALVLSRDAPLDKAELIRRLWPDAIVEERNLTQQVFTLRKALGDTPEGTLYIQTVPRHGYRFVARVVEVVPVGHELPRAPASRRLGRRAVAAALAVVAGLGLALWVVGRGRATATTLAVLPLVNGSRDTEAEYVADGITEGLIDQLARVPGLRVLARGTAFHYKGRDVEPRLAGRALHADAILTGRVVPEGNVVEVQAALVDVADGRTLWGQRYRVSLGELPGLEHTIRDAVAQKLGRRPADPAGVRKPVDEETYRLCLRGRYFWNERSEDGIRRSIESYRQALRRDPACADAWCGLANAYNVLPEYSRTTETEAFPTAEHAALQALKLDPASAEAHAALGFVRFWWNHDGPVAETEFRRALELNPGCTNAHHWYGNVFLSLGRKEQALEELREAQRVDPLSPIVGTELGAALYETRQFAAAAEQLRTILTLDSGFADAHYWLGHTLLQQGDLEGALREYREARRLASAPAALLGPIALVLRRMGRLDEARVQQRELERLREDNPVAFELAILDAGTGEIDRAIDGLERAAAERATDLAFVGVDPLFDPLRRQPRFEALVERLREPRELP